jgi:hypothetical protein
MIGDGTGTGVRHLIEQARKRPDERTHDPEKMKLARGFAHVLYNALAEALGFSLYSRTEDPAESIKRLAYGNAQCASTVT